MILRFTAMISLMLSVFYGSSAYAQTPAAAVNGPVAKPQEGFYPGWGFGTRFEGSTSGDGSVYDIATGVGYNFSHHFGVDLGVPYNFVGTPTSIKQKNAQAVSGNGLGNFGADLKWIFPENRFNVWRF